MVKKLAPVGYACIHVNLEAKTSRTMRVAGFDEAKWHGLIRDNLTDLETILKDTIRLGLGMFRISSDIIPLATHPVQNIAWQVIHGDQLKQIGMLIQKAGLRVSMHPGQYTVINSPHEEVVIRAIADVEYHTTFLDALGVNDSHKIILHVGGVYGDQVESIRRWVSAYAILSVRARARLVLENDDQHYTFEDVYGISQKCQIPILFDYFHHLCHHEGAYDLHDILRRVVNTWQAKDGSFKLHYSEQDLSKRKGAHAPSITMQNFMDFYKEVKSYNPFIMIEAKNKNIAAVKAKNCIAIVEETVRPRDVIEEWSKYKYVIMSYGYEHYKHIQKMMSTACTLQELYEALEEIMSSSKVDSAKTNTLSHVWGYLKDHANTKEKNHYFKLADNLETLDLAKDYLYKLCIKYQMDYLLQSYYFHF